MRRHVYTNKTVKMTITYAVQHLAMRKRHDKLKRKGYSNKASLGVGQRK